jgi:hypothetical protein
VGLRARPDLRWHLPDPLPPDPPERALLRLGPLELPGAPPDLEQRLAALYERLAEAGAQVWMTGTELAPFDGLGADAAVWRVADGAVARV